MNILGVKIDDKPEAEILEFIFGKLSAGERVFATTPNPEMLILAQDDVEFKKILNAADIAVPDGFGLKIGAKILGKKLKSRVAGVDLMADICRRAAGIEPDRKAPKYKVYFLGGEKGIARRAAENLKKTLPELLIVGAEFGGSFSAKATKSGEMDYWNNRVIIEHINAVCPDILFVALGHGKQEKWIFENLKYLPTVKFAMGVGGAFDFIAGAARRAPEGMRRVGLEWLWRLIIEPKRFKRIWRAVAVFPWICWKSGNKKSAA